MRETGWERLARALQVAPLGTWWRGGAWGLCVLPLGADADKESPPPTTEERTLFDPIAVRADDIEFYSPLKETRPVYLAYAKLGDMLWGAFDPDAAREATRDLVHDYGLLWDERHPIGRWPNLAECWGEAKLLFLAMSCYASLPESDETKERRNEFLDRFRQYEVRMPSESASYEERLEHARRLLERLSGGFEDYGDHYPYLLYLFSRSSPHLEQNLAELGVPAESHYQPVAGAWLRETINERLYFHGATFQITLESPARWDRGIRISSLAAALWAGLATLVIEGSHIKTCPHCGERFEAKNRRAVYCSERHRNAATSAEWRRKHPERARRRRSQ